ncbi:predicted protein [Pyrenophora tritici-repentis Pt-1C-BFP]|uniref:Uncharacterized protein n=1 Tax=Pyrenophora tritici-repentis (strain Pt-1C-BFP) TaxID=426418 RepID=B2WLU9_PYRTR|nr:uncharacterized protein PTRG_10959 [Pyrenophora tritici-repentis Pt-1C-BFP]EDU44009.1 predicted protein [Pyrenophora tritici-repentis Pt-1C-BFP]
MAVAAPTGRAHAVPSNPTQAATCLTLLVISRPVNITPAGHGIPHSAKQIPSARFEGCRTTSADLSRLHVRSHTIFFLLTQFYPPNVSEKACE